MRFIHTNEYEYMNMYNIHWHYFTRFSESDHIKAGKVMRCYTKPLHRLHYTVFHNITFIFLLSLSVVIELGFNCKSLARDSGI